MKNVKLVNLVLEQNSSDFGMCKAVTTKKSNMYILEKNNIYSSC